MPFQPALKIPPIGGKPPGYQRYGGVLKFSGNNVRYQPVVNTTVYQTVTLCCWFNCAGSTGNNQHLISKVSFFANSVTDFPIALYLNSGLTTINFNLSKGDDFSYDLQVVSPTFSSTGWHFVAASYASPLGICFVDGVYTTGSAAMTISSNSLNWTFGNSAADGGGGGAGQAVFKGSMYDARVYNVAKSPEQMAAIMRGRDDQIGLVIRAVDTIPNLPIV